MPKSHAPYPAEFRRRVVDLARSGRSTGSLAREFRVPGQTIRNWVRQADLDEGRRHDGLTTDERAEPVALRRENKRLRVEREILKKAAAWFARETEAVPPKGSDRSTRRRGGRTGCRACMPNCRRLGFGWAASGSAG